LENKAEPDQYIAENSLAMVSDTRALAAAIEAAIARNPQSVTDYKAGKTKVLGFLVGQVIRAMQGKADPALLNRLLEDKLKE